MTNVNDKCKTLRVNTFNLQIKHTMHIGKYLKINNTFLGVFGDGDPPSTHPHHTVLHQLVTTLYSTSFVTHSKTYYCIG